MILGLVLFSFAVAVQPAFSYPLGIFADAAQGFDISTDFDAYYGPYNYDYLRGSRLWGSYGGYGGFGYGGFGGYGGYGGYGGFGGYGNYGALRGLWPYDGYVDGFDGDYYGGYYYGNPVRTIDVGRDRLVRDFAVTETDNWVRDQTTFRAPTRVRYATYGGYPARRVYAAGFGGPRTSSLRTGGDLTYLRR